MNNVPEPDTSRPTTAASDSASSTGRLGEFEELGILGKGGFSVVYKARDHALGRTVAIKEYMPRAIAHCLPNGMIRPKSLEYESAFKAGLTGFLNEARLLAQFTHPALVHVYRVWEKNGTAYMAMQYCVGKTLREISQSDPAKVKNEDWLKATFAPILDGLELLHANNCFHRDISLDNILILDNGGRPILLDFGAARQIVGGMTQSLTVVLKPGFAPIEQYADDGSVPQGPWTDVYGVGAVLYYLLTGQPPLASVARVFKDPITKLADADEFSGVSHALRQAIDRALAVDPKQRIQSIAQLREALQWPAVKPEGQSSKTPGTPIEVRNKTDSGQTPRPPQPPPDAPAGKAPEAPAPAVPGKDSPPIDSDARVPAPDLPTINLSEKMLDALLETRKTASEEKPAPDNPDSVQPDGGANAPAPPASAPSASFLSQGARKAAETLKTIGRPSRFRNTALGIGLVAAVALAAALGWPHKPAQTQSGPSASVNALTQAPANSPPASAAAVAPPGMGGQALTSQDGLPQAHTAATPVAPDHARQPPSAAPPTSEGGPQIAAKPAPDFSAPGPTSLVHLSIKPWGQIAVDGQPMGVSPPVTGLSLHPGQHMILITNGDFPPVLVPVTVPEGKDIVVSYQFE